MESPFFLSKNEKSSDYSESSLYNTIEAKGIKAGGSFPRFSEKRR
nr:MAG TPA: hypothetical protein [Caudoviricetes sp.]